MSGSIRIGSVLGITIRVHYLWFVLGAIIVMPAARPQEALLQFVMLFAIVVLHELGHSVVAQSFGIRVVDITLWPLGGMARMAEIPESTKIEALIALAGPAVNFVLAAIAAAALFTGWLAVELHPAVANFGLWFVGANLLLGAFNLIPAFPMDGGRVLRAILGHGGNWLRATEIAVRVGRVFALLLALVGVFGIPGVLPPFQVLLILLALWLWWAGGAELWAVRVRHTQNPFEALRNFVRQHADWGSQDSTAAPRAETEAAAAGFRAEDIERLERFRGRLSQFRKE